MQIVIEWSTQSARLIQRMGGRRWMLPTGSHIPSSERSRSGVWKLWYFGVSYFNEMRNSPNKLNIGWYPTLVKHYVQFVALRFRLPKAASPKLFGKIMLPTVQVETVMTGRFSHRPSQTFHILHWLGHFTAWRVICNQIPLNGPCVRLVLTWFFATLRLQQTFTARSKRTADITDQWWP